MGMNTLSDAIVVDNLFKEALKSKVSNRGGYSVDEAPLKQALKIMTESLSLTKLDCDCIALKYGIPPSSWARVRGVRIPSLGGRSPMKGKLPEEFKNIR